RRRADAARRAGELAGVRQPETVDSLLQGQRHDAGRGRHHRRQRGGVVGPPVQASQGPQRINAARALRQPCTGTILLEQRRDGARPADREQPAVPPQVRRLREGARGWPLRPLAGVQPQHGRRPRREHHVRPDPQLQDLQRRRLCLHRRRLLRRPHREHNMRPRPWHK
ncbi:hypothetical protein ACJX0J_033635, partial [Zea mays]